MDTPPPDSTPQRSRFRRHPVRWTIVGLLALFVLIQFIPYGRDYTNPKVNVTPEWPSAKVEELATAACADCHSNTTEWPKKARIAPASWLIKRDVDEGRSRLNWSEPCGEAGEAAEAVRGGEMPPLQYTLIHRNAKLSDKDKETLAAGLEDALSKIQMSECSGGD
ncbi:MAG: heme-binding domain-containing protein [Thermoleophilia bacterium]|nr:heme-binding domain-containing protein [Thermoleophilia bacterium]